MINKKTISDILKTLPGIINRTNKSAGAYLSETDTTYTGGSNTSGGFDMSTDPLANNDMGSFSDRIIINK
jgi:hypothetical protein